MEKLSNDDPRPRASGRTRRRNRFCSNDFENRSARREAAFPVGGPGKREIGHDKTRRNTLRRSQAAKPAAAYIAIAGSFAASTAKTSRDAPACPQSH